MSRTYKAIGINLKAAPMGETDRLLTILTQEQGLIRAIAPGARKHNSRLGGRSGLFVVNELLIAKGKSLDKVTQAETRRSFPKLSGDLAKLTASQYLAELVLCQALSDQPQAELFSLLIEHLERLERASKPSTLACLAQATFHLLALAGVAPQVHLCCLTRQPLVPDLSNPEWRIGFSLVAGGTVQLSEIAQFAEQTAATEPSDPGSISLGLTNDAKSNAKPVVKKSVDFRTVRDRPDRYHTNSSVDSNAGLEAADQQRPATATADAVRRASSGRRASPAQIFQLSASELLLLQQLAQPELIVAAPVSPTVAADSIRIGPHRYWQRIERVLRQYAQYQFDRPIRSAALIDTCFTSV